MRKTDTLKVFDVADKARHDLHLDINSDGAKFLMTSAAFTALNVLREKHPGVPDRQLIHLAIMELGADLR